MASSFTVIAIFSFALFAGTTTIEARKDPGEYWQGLPKNEALIEAIEHLVQPESSLSSLNKITGNNYHGKKQSFVKDFEPRPNVSAYGEDGKVKDDKSFTKEFEPRPNVSAYGRDGKLEEGKSFSKDFEPRPNISAYGDDDKLRESKSFVKDFEPRLSATAYGDDIGLEGAKEFDADN